MRPQDPHSDGTGLRFETGEHGGDYPDNMRQAITLTAPRAAGPSTCHYGSTGRSWCRTAGLIEAEAAFTKGRQADAALLVGSKYSLSICGTCKQFLSLI
jgi:hypothetical protein